MVKNAFILVIFITSCAQDQGSTRNPSPVPKSLDKKEDSSKIKKASDQSMLTPAPAFDPETELSGLLLTAGIDSLVVPGELDTGPVPSNVFKAFEYVGGSFIVNFPKGYLVAKLDKNSSPPRFTVAYYRNKGGLVAKSGYTDTPGERQTNGTQLHDLSFDDGKSILVSVKQYENNEPSVTVVSVNQTKEKQTPPPPSQKPGNTPGGTITIPDSAPSSQGDDEDANQHTGAGPCTTEDGGNLLGRAVGQAIETLIGSSGPSNTNQSLVAEDCSAP